MGFKFISEDERNVLQRKFFSSVHGSSDPVKAREIREKIINDKDYLLKHMERASPLDQWINLFPSDSIENHIQVVRTNFPGMKKSRKWLIPFEDSELVTTIAARIVDSITLRQSH